LDQLITRAKKIGSKIHLESASELLKEQIVGRLENNSVCSRQSYIFSLPLFSVLTANQPMKINLVTGKFKVQLKRGMTKFQEKKFSCNGIEKEHMFSLQLY
jgi:hypothetical protein